MELPLQLQALFENCLDGILITRADGTIDAANPSACRLLGRTEAQLVAAGRAGLLDANDPRVATGVAERDRTGRYFGEVTMIRGDGARFSAEMSSVAYNDPLGTRCAFVIFRDVSERQRAIAELSVARENLAAIIENSPIAMQGLGADGRTMFWNKAAERLFGWSADEAVGRLNPIVGPEQADEYAELRGRALDGQIVSGVEVERMHKDGSSIAVSLSTSLIKSVDGDMIALIGVYEDLRQRKAIERERSRVEQLGALRELAVGVRHEMNNTLAALRLEVELHLDGPDIASGQRASAATMLALTDRLAAALTRLDRVEQLQSVPYLGDVRMLDISEQR